MKLALFSHCAIDSITIGDSSFEQIGGAACYGGLTARSLKFDVDLYTKFGQDFPFDYLTKNKINFPEGLSDRLTTRFKIQIEGNYRTLSLQNSCDAIEYFGIDADGTLVSPIFNEISIVTFEKIKKDSNFLFLDPQGFLRRKEESTGNIVLEKTDLDLSGISAIKVNPEEINNIVGSSDVESLKTLQKMGIEHVVLTDKVNVSMLVKDRLYSIKLPNREVYDTTGIGDIFCAAFSCTMIKEKDFLWALCFAGGAAQAALESKKVGLEKVPLRGAIETNASYFYNLIKFKQV